MLQNLVPFSLDGQGWGWVGCDFASAVVIEDNGNDGEGRRIGGLEDWRIESFVECMEWTGRGVGRSQLNTERYLVALVINVVVDGDLSRIRQRGPVIRYDSK
jgi:hypothetical protein